MRPFCSNFQWVGKNFQQKRYVTNVKVADFIKSPPETSTTGKIWKFSTFSKHITGCTNRRKNSKWFTNCAGLQDYWLFRPCQINFSFNGRTHANFWSGGPNYDNYNPEIGSWNAWLYRYYFISKLSFNGISNMFTAKIKINQSDCINLCINQSDD